MGAGAGYTVGALGAGENGLAGALAGAGSGAGLHGFVG